MQERGGARVGKGKKRGKEGGSAGKEGKEGGRGEKRGREKGAGRGYSPYQSQFASGAAACD